MNAKRQMPKRVALYVRTSTANGQTTRNQERELQAVAKRHGWAVATVYRDQGISGAKGRDKRPGLDKLMQAVARREIDMVAAWSVDRLGRSLTDLLGVLQELHAKGVDLYLHQQGLDTSTPSGRAMFQMLGVFAEFERAMIRERVMATLRICIGKSKCRVVWGVIDAQYNGWRCLARKGTLTRRPRRHIVRLTRDQA